jgi:hypothetical protein
MKQYVAVVSKIIPSLAPDPKNLGSDPSWSQEQAEGAFFRRLTLDEELGTDRRGVNGHTASKTMGRVPVSPSQAAWRNVWTLCAAGVLLFIAMTVSAVTPSTNQQNRAALEQQGSDAEHEREVLRSEMAR